MYAERPELGGQARNHLDTRRVPMRTVKFLGFQSDMVGELRHFLRLRF